MLLSPAIWIVAVLYLVTNCTCDTEDNHHLTTSRWKSKHHHRGHHNYSDSGNYLGRKYGSARRQYYVPSTVSPWLHVAKKSFGPFTTTTTTTTTTTRPPASVHSAASHRMNLKLVADNVKVRHRSRFPHLERVIDRLDKYTVSTQRPKASKNDLGSGNDDDDNEEDIFDDDDLNVDDDYLLDAEDTNSLDDDTDYLEDDTADDEDDIDDEDDDEGAPGNGKTYDSSSSWLGSQQKPHQHVANVNAVSGTNSPFTTYKWDMFGTKQRVDETRRIHMQQQLQNSAQTSQSSVNTAVLYKHIMRMATESRCKRPLPRIVNVMLEHPSPGITYSPHCTLLYRCSEDTGCCEKHNTRCAPKTQAQVHLYFYTSSSSSRTGNRVVKLPFYNHTECDCLPRDSTNPIVTHEGGSSTIEPKSTRLFSRSNQLAPASFKKCNCPEEFVPSVLRRWEIRCICDCEDSNIDCLRMKKGKEHFSLKDRLCINTSKCGSPVCEYGSYLRDTGRCPKLQEKFDAFAEINVNSN